MVMWFHGNVLYPLRASILGQTGVDLFFVLSGFLITTILLQAKPGDWGEMRRFYIRRTLRIFPLYYGFLAVSSLVGAAISIWFWIYLQNFPMAFGAQHLGPPHFWSLAVEEQFYLVWPFLVLFWPRRWLSHAMWAVVALSILLRVLLLRSDVSIFYLTFTRLDGLAAGGLLALYYSRGRLAVFKPLFAAGMAGCFTLLVVGALLSRGSGLAWFQVVKYSAATGTYACLMGLLVVTHGGWAHRFLESKPMRAIGRVSYGLYVFHWVVLGVVIDHMGGYPAWARIAAFLLGTYLVAVGSFYGFEKHFTDLKNRLAPEPKFETV